MTEHLTQLLTDVAHGFQSGMREAVEESGGGLTPFQGKTLSLIARSPGCTQQALADQMGCDKAQVTRAIKELIARALIDRRVSHNDWRAAHLEVTPAGTMLFDAFQHHRQALAARVFAVVTEAEQAALARTLEKIRAGLANERQARLRT